MALKSFDKKIGWTKMESDQYDVFSIIVQRLRQEKSLRAASAKIGISYPYLHQLASGLRKNPSSAILRSLCDYYAIAVAPAPGARAARKVIRPMSRTDPYKAELFDAIDERDFPRALRLLADIMSEKRGPKKRG